MGRIKKAALPVEMKTNPEIIQKIQMLSLLIEKEFDLEVIVFFLVLDLRLILSILAVTWVVVLGR